MGLPTAEAGIFGVPTQIGTDGRVCTGVNVPAGIGCTAAALDPPGYLILTGVDDVDAAGDTVHQMRLFIEVTGTTLDVRIFDPGRSGARDQTQDGNTTFTYQLINAAGTTIKTITLGVDAAATTQNRLARMSATPADTAFVALNAGTAFAGLTPGRFELRITASDDADPGVLHNDRNTFGVDIRNGTAAGAAHYNVYTFGLDDDLGQGTPAPVADTSLVIGALETGGNGGDISQGMVFYPYVTRGCAVDASNFDMDGHASASTSLNSTLGVSTTLPVSGATAHAEPATPVTIHATTGVLTDSYNYGLWSLQNNTGTQFNIIDWRIADFRGWADNPANLPRDTVDAFRTYLPNGYTGGIPPLTNATAPLEPVLGATYAYRSGANPPVAGSLTRFVVQVQLYNPGPAVIGLNHADDQIVSGLPAGGANLGNISCFQNAIANNVGTPVNGGTFARCNFSGASVSVAVGDVVLLSYEFDFTPAAAGTFSITNPPAAPAAGTYNNGALAPTSTTWAQYSRFFPTGTRFAETLGPICDLRAATSAAVTRASLAGLRVDPAGQVDFAVLSQRGTRAFNLYATFDRSGQGTKRLLNSAPIRASFPDATRPVLYHADTGPISAPYLLVEEVETSGRRRLLGPYAMGDARLRAAFARIESSLREGPFLERGPARQAAPRVAARASARTPADGLGRRPRSRSVGIKVEVDEPGEVRLSLADLRVHGLPPTVLPSRLRVTNQGSDVPFSLVAGADGRPEALAFVNPGLATAYTGTSVFIVDWGVRRPQMEVGLTYFDGPAGPRTTRVEKDRYYAPGAPLGSDPWIWDFVAAGESWPRGDDPDAGTFDLPRLDPAASGLVPLRIRLAGVSPGLHTVEAQINGVAVGSLMISGQQPSTLVGAIPASALRAFGNSLTLAYASEPEDGLVYLGHLDLDTAPAGPLPEAAVRLGPYDTGPPRLVSETNYLVVTHPAFRPQARNLAALKAGEGYRTAVVGVEEAYDRYTAGITEAAAVARLIADQARLGRLEYVLVVGDDSFDPRGRLDASPESFVPSPFAWDREFGRIPSDGLFADVDGDGAPDLAIGRLPVRTSAEADALVAKIARQSAVLQASARHVFGVDNQLPGDPSFESMAGQASSLLGGADVTWARLAEGTDRARQTFFAALNAGARAAHFFGHASFDGWADERFVTVDDVGALADGPETLAFAWACESQWFLYPFGPSLGEALVLLPQGGALASFGPVGITDPGPQTELLADLYPRFFTQRLTLGEAIRQAKMAALRRDPGRLAPVVYGWSLLGDPSLRLPELDPR